MYLSSFPINTKNIATASLMLLPSGIMVYVTRELLGVQSIWLPWINAVLLSTILISTYFCEDLKCIKKYAIIQFTIYVLGINMAWDWGLIPFINSSRYWFSFLELSSIKLDVYQMAALRSVAFALLFGIIYVYIPQEPENVSTQYVKKNSLPTLDRYGVKTRILIAFMMVNLSFLVFSYIPAILEVFQSGSYFEMSLAVLKTYREIKGGIFSVDQASAFTLEMSRSFILNGIHQLLEIIGLNGLLEKHLISLVDGLVCENILLRLALDIILFGLILVLG